LQYDSDQGLDGGDIAGHVYATTIWTSHGLRYIQELHNLLAATQGLRRGELLYIRLLGSGRRILICCANGAHINKAILHVRKAGEKPQEYLTITMEEAFISSFNDGGSDGSLLPTENATLNFAKIEFKYSQQEKDGSLGPANPKGWDIKGTRATPLRQMAYHSWSKSRAHLNDINITKRRRACSRSGRSSQRSPRSPPSVFSTLLRGCKRPRRRYFVAPRRKLVKRRLSGPCLIAEGTVPSEVEERLSSTARSS
jgi:hypothetical protein